MLTETSHCVLDVVRQSQKFCRAADPLPGVAGRPKFNQLEMVTTFTYRPTLVKINARNWSHRGNRPTKVGFLSALVLSPLRAQQFGILCLTVCVIQLLGLISFDVTWKRICEWHCVSFSALAVFSYCAIQIDILLTYLLNSSRQSTAFCVWHCSGVFA